MKNVIAVATLAMCVLGGLSTAAGASTIEVEGLARNELPNIEAAGRVTFESVGFIVNVRITCDTTIKGLLNRRAEGALTLGNNEAGIVVETRMANCQGGTASGVLVDLITPARLSWLAVVERTTAELSGERVRIGLRALGLGGECLYTTLVIISSTAEGGGRFRTLRPALHRVLYFTEVDETPCPNERQVQMSGSLTTTRPANGIGLRIA